MSEMKRAVRDYDKALRRYGITMRFIERVHRYSPPYTWPKAQARRRIRAGLKNPPFFKWVFFPEDVRKEKLAYVLEEHERRRLALKQARRDLESLGKMRACHRDDFVRKARTYGKLWGYEDGEKYKIRERVQRAHNVGPDDGHFDNQDCAPVLEETPDGAALDTSGA